ncbi:hypothetical protein BD410DRAFT_278796 [Rickenella mellea]|uniref:Uncharacterized protein n=1 Tax=Rickenella mellea TaxID=50990 RepID=A0A4Y7Q3B3_9AGAM|nr:hypothetical protein BD410DRAFT_278796 [Rickenella mellea]
MTSVYAPQPQPITPELLEEVQYQLALDASLQANSQPSMSAEAMQRRVQSGADSDYVPAYIESPTAPPNWTYSREDVQVVAHFFDAIIAGQVEAVQLLLNSGMDVECQDRLRRGMTPLYAAVRANQSRMMFLLINAGADVNKFSRDPDITDLYPTRTSKADYTPIRTPLMRAAQNGNVRMVRDLVEQCEADPMIISPDGQSAQRLAAKAGHRAVVEYLPVNRGGIGKRIRYDYHTRYHRIRYLVKTIYSILKFFLWTVPKFFVWDIPKYVVKMLYRFARRIYNALPPVRTWPSLIWDAIVDIFKAIVRGSKAAIRGTIRGAKSIGRGTVRLVKGVPKVLKTCYSATKRFVKAIPDKTVRAAKAIGRTTVDTGRWTWKFLKSIPGMTVRAAKAIGRIFWGCCCWTLDFMKRIGGAVIDIAKAITNAFVTVYFYLESLIQRLRAVKFTDVVRAVQRVLYAIFVAFPKTLLGGLKTAVKFVDSVLTCLTLGLWWLVTRLAEWIVRGIIFIPEQILRILLIMVQGIGKLFTELWLFIHPRSMM